MNGLEPEAVAPALRAGVLRLARKLRVERDQSALTNNKVSILSHLARTGMSTPSQISRDERQHPQSLSRAFAALEADGLIQRQASPADGRQSILQLTETGHAALRADMQLRDQRLADTLSKLSPTELGVLAIAADILERMDERP